MENLNNLPPFYVGQKVVAINPGNWKDANGCASCGPDKGDVVLVTRLLFDEEWCIVTKEFGDDDWYPCSEFRPLTESPFPSLTMSRVVEKESILISMN